MSASVVIQKDTAKRLIKDIKQIKNEHIEGIHYMHDETNILQGSALIIGPPDSPYEGGYYLFLFDFPCDYPYSPPKLKFLTNDGHTRMHPNLYKNGKVCLSILNTWSGESWTGCQTISSVLLTIRSIMTSGPLLHEPGIDKFHRDFNTYTEIIRYKNISTAILNIINDDTYDNSVKFLINIARKDFIDNYDKKMLIVKASEQMFISSEGMLRQVDSVFYTAVYNMRCKIDYKSLIADMKTANCIINKKLKDYKVLDI